MTRELGVRPTSAEESNETARATSTERFIIRCRWWLRWKYEQISTWINRVQRHRLFAVGLLWTLTVLGNLLLVPNFGILLLLATVAIATVRSGLNPFSTTVVFVVSIFIIPARFAFLGASLPMTVGLGALILWSFHRMQNGAVASERPHRMGRWILLFVMAKLLAYANAQLHFRSDRLVANADRQMIVFLAFAGIGLYVAEVCKDERTKHRLVNLLIFGAAFMSVTAILEQQTGLDISRYLRPPGFTQGGRLDGEGATLAPERFGVRRAFGTATGPLEYTTMILAVLPLAVHRTVYGRDLQERRYGTVMAFIIIIGLPMSVSRTSVVGLFLALLLIGLGLRSPERRRLAAGLGVTMLFLLVTFSAVSNAFFQLTTSFFVSDSSTNLQVAGRTGDYEIVGSLFSDRPILGTGLASSDPTEPRLVDGRRVRNLYLDNQYLSEAVTGGIVGVAALVGLIVAGIRAARRARAIAANPVDANLAYSVAASLMIMGLTFAFFDALAFRSTTGLFFVLLGLAGALESNVLSFDPSSNRTQIGRIRMASEQPSRV